MPSIIAPMRWDLFVRVVDNFGDAGVGWRLAADLAARGQTVRLWIDDPAPLAWMAPNGAAGVQVHRWPADDAPGLPAPGEVVVELFGAEPPAGFVRMMAAQARPPLWINLEYLSAEAYVGRSHGLPSPLQAGPGRGLVRWFYFPGFTPRTGGLLRESTLMAERAAFDAPRWLRERGWAADAVGGEVRRASVFCYDDVTMTLPAGWSVLLAQGPAQRRFGASTGATALPWLDQPGYDRLLWACDLNIVRGEDSFVRAQWAGVPFVWHLYPQSDGAQARKLEAFLDLFLDASEPAFAAALRQLWRAWNGLLPRHSAEWPALEPWQAACERWREGLLAQPDLCSSLIRFVTARQ